VSPEVHGPGDRRDRRPRWRIVLGSLLWLLAALIALAGTAAVIGIVAGPRGGSGRAGGPGGAADVVVVVLMFLAALAAGAGAHAVLTRRRRAGPGGAITGGGTITGRAITGRAITGGGADTAGGAITTGGAVNADGAVTNGSGALPTSEPEPGGAPLLLGFPPPDHRVTYREHGSQFPVTGAAITAVLVAASVAAIAAHGSVRGWGWLPAMVIFFAGIFLGLVLMDLANGIEIGGGRFAAGARSVPPFGQIWRRVEGPLAAVQSWDVISSQAARPLRFRGRAPGWSLRRSKLPFVVRIGDLRTFGRRRVLLLVVDPGSVSVRFPHRMRDGYVLVTAANVGYVWDGVVMIGTRHPAALAAALERALPGRRGTPGAPPP